MKPRSAARGLTACHAAAVLCAAALAASPALAQEPAKQGAIEAPCAKLVAAQRVAPSAAGALAMGDCFERAGKMGSARAAFDEARALAKREGEEADRRMAALDQSRPMLVLDAPAVPRGTSIRIDGVPIDPAAVGTPIPAEPGPHLVEVARGAAHWTARVDVEPTGVVHLALPAEFAAKAMPEAPAPREAAPAEPAAEEEAPPPRVAPPAKPPASTVRWEAHRISGVALGAAGVVALVTGTVFGGVAVAKKSASNDGHCDASDVCDATGRSLRADAIRAGNAATATLFAGGAAVASGLALFFTAPIPPRGDAAKVGLALGPGSARLVGSW